VTSPGRLIVVASRKVVASWMIQLADTHHYVCCIRPPTLF
jgi:hypothetical protein